MIRGSTTRIALADTALALVATVGPVQAGGFAIREQSAYFQGLAFAGAAAGGPSLSSMFWNPATMTQQTGWLTKELVATGVASTSRINPTAATSLPPPFGFPGLIGLGGSGNVSEAVLVPASYTVYRPNDRWAIGIATNAPFGLATRPNYLWAGMFYGRDSEAFSFNVTPQVAVQLDHWISVGVGVQVQYFSVELDQAFPGTGLAASNMKVTGDGVSVGFTAGVTITPTPWTTIGIGYRSAIDQELEGQISRPSFSTLVVGVGVVTVPGLTTSLTATLPLPQSVNVGVRQRINERLTLMGTVEWTDWSRFGTIPVVYPTIPPPLLAVAAVPRALPFEWEDGWFVSVGAEFQWSPAWTVRAGVAFEHSPINDTVRGVRLADNDRLWLGAGLSYNWNERLSFDLGYTHIFMDDAPINIVPGNPLFNPLQGTFSGTGETSVDILSLALRYRFGPLPSRAVVTKG